MLWVWFALFVRLVFTAFGAMYCCAAEPNVGIFLNLFGRTLVFGSNKLACMRAPYSKTRQVASEGS